MPVPPPLDAPVAGLGDAEELARSWLLELLAERPPAAAAAVDPGRLGADGPALCAAVVGALVSDRELARLGPEGDRSAPVAAVREIVVGGSPGDVVVAVECLRRVVWAAIERSAPPPAPASLAGRLAHVCAMVAQTALAADSASEVAAVGDAPAAHPPQPGLTAVTAARLGEGPLWIEALERLLADGGRSGRPFTLLLVDIDGAEHLRMASADSAADAFARVARAVREQVRRPDVIAHEDDGRLWVIASDTGRTGAEALARRVVQAVEEAVSLHGAALTGSVGIAVYPDDGRTASELTAQAEEGMFAARASGIRV